MPQLVRSAHAKINLALAVGPPREGDGFHPICSWFAPIELHDELRIEQLAPGTPSRYEIAWAKDAPKPSPIDWPIERDLAARAHRLLERETARDLPISMRLTKRIPVGGGLGGGSSDAAAMLRALITLFALDLPATRLHAIAPSLGSDVPYFLLEPLTPAIVEGVGESIAASPSIRSELILILPPFGCPTGQVYQAFDALPPKPWQPAAVRDLAQAAPDALALFNDLAAAAEAVQPRLRHCRQAAIQALRRPVHITGSGSTLFALVHPNENDAALIAWLRDALPGCLAVPARFLSAPH